MKKLIGSILILSLVALASCKKDSSAFANTSNRVFVRVLEVSDDGNTVTSATEIQAVYIK